MKREFSAGGVLVRRLRGGWVFAAIRPAGKKPGVWALPKGLIDSREKPEETAVREVAEETGVLVTNVRYDSSQPWPFPSSLMLGFFASATPGSIVRVSGELEDARWYTRAEITSGQALAPPTQSISWRLIEIWLKGAS